MANEVRFDIVANDKASKLLDQVADDAEKVEKLDPTVTVKADTKAATHSVDGFADQLDKLTDTDKVIVLALRAGAAKTELTDLATQLATVDATDPNIDVKFDRYAQVSDELTQLEAQIKAVGDADPTAGGNLEKARDRLGEIGTEASRAQDAVHSMAGNAIGDMAATATGIGPVGEAIGQLTELATGGEASLKQLATAGLGIGAITGGIALINAALGHFRDEARKSAEIEAFNIKNVKDYTQAVLDAQKALGQTADVKLDTTGLSSGMSTLKTRAQELIDTWKKAGEVKVFDPSQNGIHDILPILSQAHISAQTFAEAIAGSQSALLTVDAAAGKAHLSVDKYNTIISTVASEHQKFVEATRDAADKTEFFAQALEDTSGPADDYLRQIDAMNNRTKSTTTTLTKFRDRLKDTAKATDDLDRQYQGLSDSISQDQAWIDLADQIDATTQAGKDAITAQNEANKAAKNHAKDAADKQREATQAMRDYQTEVNNAKQSIIDLGKTAGATPVEVDAALKKIDQGDLAGAKADAEAWFKRNPVKIDADLRVRLINLITAGVGAPVQGSTRAATPTTIVNQYLARPPSGRDTADTVARWARINGR